MSGEQYTDVQVADMVRMLLRDQLDHEMICVLARDRILALSGRFSELTSANADLRESLAASEATVARLVGERDNPKIGKAHPTVVYPSDASKDSTICGLLRKCEELTMERDAAEALSESRRLTLEEAYEAAEQWHHSVEWEGQEHTGKVMAICAAAIAATGSTAMDNAKKVD